MNHKMIMSLSLLSLAIFLSAGRASAGSACSDSGGDSLREQVCVLVNQARAKNGLAPLILNHPISKVAQDYSEDMAERKFFDHEDPDGGTLPERFDAGHVPWSAIGENIAKNGSTADAVVKAWLNSPEHYKNIMSPAYGHVGIGHSAPYWVQDFSN